MIKPITIIERDMTEVELARMNAGFDEYARDHDVAIQDSDRYGYVALDGDAFIGCSSGLAYKNGETYNGWFYLTDLFVEKDYRSQGIGSKLLKALEDMIYRRGVRKIWTWTAGYEAPAFYKKQSYEVFAELENWYSNGASRVAMRKTLKSQEEGERE